MNKSNSFINLPLRSFIEILQNSYFKKKLMVKVKCKKYNCASLDFEN